MRLIERTAKGLSLTKDFDSHHSYPPYAVLSHTWMQDDDEVSMKDIINGNGTDKRGYDKVLFCIEQTEHDNIQYFWIDSCCIDQTNTVELTTAINSMFRWYQKAARCYVYLSDVSFRTADRQSVHVDWFSDFRNSRWHTRGWTLPELLAPKIVTFYSRDRVRLGDKYALREELASITGIEVAALASQDLAQIDATQKFRWAAKRQTSREEDQAYCLLGIFGIFMPLIYGEGQKNAMRRLRRELAVSSTVDSPTGINDVAMADVSAASSSAPAAVEGAERQHPRAPTREMSREAWAYMDRLGVEQEFKCVAVIGPPFSGKSMFIDSLLPSSNCKEEIVIRQGLSIRYTCVTSRCVDILSVSGHYLTFKIYPVVHRGHRVKLINAPAFRDAYYTSDPGLVSFETLLETIKSMADEPSLTSREWISRFHGLIYLLPITYLHPEKLYRDPPIHTGNCNPTRTVLATTSWFQASLGSQSSIEERALIKPGGWWENMYEAGSPILRHNETKESAMNVLDWLLFGAIQALPGVNSGTGSW